MIKLKISVQSTLDLGNLVACEFVKLRSVLGYIMLRVSSDIICDKTENLNPIMHGKKNLCIQRCTQKYIKKRIKFQMMQ